MLNLFKESLSAKAVFASFVCVVLAITLSVPSFASIAYGDQLSDARATLDAAEKRVAELDKEAQAIQKEMEELETEIEETTEKVNDAQAKMMEGQDELSATVLASYKNEDRATLINVFLQSEDINDFLKNMEYLQIIQQAEADQVAAQRELKQEFEAALAELDEKKDKQQELLKEAAEKRSEAEKTVASASQKVAKIEAEQEAARLAALEAQAKRMAEEQEAASEVKGDANASTSDNWNTSDHQGSSNSGSSDSGSSSNSSNSSSDASTGWRSGVASAYGGSSDPSTPNPGYTATGAICNDHSMGVAVPMAWSGYRKYFGHAVEIRYGGKTVVATINDCGYMGGGSRSLDLQPGVFKAFGYSTCNAWGLRTVQYRIL